MDTDELSQDAYKAVILTAEMFNHNLTLHFGYLSMGCEDEEDYLRQSEEMIDDWLSIEDKEDLLSLLDDLFFGEPPTIKAFKKVLSEIQDNIRKVREIPFDKRTFDFGGPEFNAIIQHP